MMLDGPLEDQRTVGKRLTTLMHQATLSESRYMGKSKSKGLAESGDWTAFENLWSNLPNVRLEPGSILKKHVDEMFEVLVSVPGAYRYLDAIIDNPCIPHSESYGAIARQAM